MTSVFLSVGDASGDQLAADLVSELRVRRPDLQFAGMGGAEMEKAGVELTVHQDALAVGGLFELAGQLPRIVRTWRDVTASARTTDPDLVVLVDSGGFNLPLARHLRRRSNAPILYYAAPQVWAWRRGRIRKLARRIDRLAVILPFERDVYSDTGIRVDYVGHPLAEKLASVAMLGRDEACRELNLDPSRRWVALFPGSRRNEVAHHLPVQLAAARELHRHDATLSFGIAVAPSIDEKLLHEEIQLAAFPETAVVRLLHGANHRLIRASDAVVAKPGTTTVEVALLQRPMVVVGRANPMTAALVRRMIQVEFLAMPNLIAGRAIVPELLQGEARPGAVADALRPLLYGPERQTQLAELAQVAEALGIHGPGPAARTASIAEEMLGASRA